MKPILNILFLVLSPAQEIRNPGNEAAAKKEDICFINFLLSI
jgi:hypothetical protein